MNQTELSEQICRCPIFHNLNTEESMALAGHGEIVACDEGARVFSEGDIAERFIIVVNGDVLIRRREDETRSRDIARFIAGESFGEMDVLRGSVRSVNAIATTPTTLLVIPGTGKTFTDILQEDPVIFAGVMQKLIAYVAGRIRSTNRLLGENSAWIKEIRRQVYTDKLTGLHNTIFLKDTLPTFPPRNQPASVLLFFKPDRFKEVNDTFGHEVGDQAIQLLSRLFHETIAPIGSAVRYRGNEFVALLPGMTADRSLRVASSLHKAVEHIDLSSITGGAGVTLTASIGVAAYPADTDDVDEEYGENGEERRRRASRDGELLLELAYQRMLNARNDGGHRTYCGGS